MIELAFINQMMPVGGVLVIDDTLLPSVAATITYIEANLPFVRVHATSRYVAYVKWKGDKRSWSYFSPFYANFSGGHGKHRVYVKDLRGIVEHKPLKPSLAQQPRPEGGPAAAPGPEESGGT